MNAHTWTPTPRDLARFWGRVVRGPSDRSCWIWTGAIADDAYGRFWVNIHGKGRVLRPHRFAYIAATGEHLTEHDVIEHLVCDNPICVRFDGTELDHLARSTQAANLARMGQRGRGGGDPLTYRWRSTDRASLAARSRRLRDAVRDGWDHAAVDAALAEPDTQPLW